MYDLAVIGAGPGGYEAALQAGRMGKKVLLAEKQHIGGTCLNVGCIPTKTFLHSATILEHARHADEFGVNVSGVTFDMAAVLARKNKIVAQLTKGVAGMLKAAKVETVMGAARITGIGKIEVDATPYEARHILIASGSRPAAPPIPGIDSPAVLDSTGMLNLDRVPESLTVIGGGVIGIEFASFFASVGSKVTVIEMLDSICPMIERDVVQVLFRTLTKQKVAINTSARVEKIEGKTVTFAGKGGTKQVESELILVATGRAPVVEGLGLDEMKIDYDRKGIKTDDAGKTNVANIWACGDVTGRCLLAHSATREGQVAVNNMFGMPDRMRYDAMPSVVYSHPEIASVGMTEAQAKEKGIAYRASKKPLAVAGRYTVEHGPTPGVCKVIVGEERGEILGVHMAGGGCSEMIWGAAALIEGEMRAVDTAQVIFPHPTISEAIKETVGH